MERSLLSIDWDYFIYSEYESWGSLTENDRNLIDLWYKRYLQEKSRGKDIGKSFYLSGDLDRFWERIKNRFIFTEDIKVYVSDSHALSYDIAKEHNCTVVYLFDSHADLGYGGLSSLNFEVNCSNWLGKLLKDAQIRKANIIYSPYTTEKPEFFEALNSMYNIQYFESLEDLDNKKELHNGKDLDNKSFDNSEQGKGIMVDAVHICRSGAWTPPWFDEKFMHFVNDLKVPYKIVNCPERSWDVTNIKFADQVNYLLA